VTGFDMKSLVQASLADLRFGRKTPITLTEDQGGEGEQDRRAGSVSAPNFNRKGAGLLDFMRAVAAKDYGAIREIHRKHGMKALSEGGGATSSASLGAGGALVPPEFSTEIIDLLRPEALLRNAKPDIVTMTSPQYFRPRLATAGTASYIGETTAIAPSQETFDQITLNAKKLAAIVPVSNELLRDSNPSVEKTVRDDLVKVIALKEDAQFLFGTGSATAPTGLFNRSGVQKFTPATNGDTVTYETPLNMYFKLPTANVPIRRAAWFTNPALIRTLLDVKDSQGRPIFMNYWDIQQGSIKQTDVNLAGTLMGRPLYTSTQIPLTTTGSGNTTTLALIEMSEILIGNMADLMLDTSNEASYYDGTNTISLWQSDMTGFRAVMRHDCTAYHDQAIVIYPGLLY
jgi:HK97 family phage major capsid protein